MSRLGAPFTADETHAPFFSAHGLVFSTLVIPTTRRYGLCTGRLTLNAPRECLAAWTTDQKSQRTS
jgi:hypothetical protein